MVQAAGLEKLSKRGRKDTDRSSPSIVQGNEKSRVIRPGHGTNAFCVSKTSHYSAESDARYEKKIDENKARFMDASSFYRFLLSSDYALCRKISRQFEELQTLLIDLRNETGDLQFIQDLLRTQIGTLRLQADKYVFQASVQQEVKESITNRCDALMLYLNLIFVDCIVSTVLLATVGHLETKENTNWESQENSKPSALNKTIPYGANGGGCSLPSTGKTTSHISSEMFLARKQTLQIPFLKAPGKIYSHLWHLTIKKLFRNIQTDRFSQF